MQMTVAEALGTLTDVEEKGAPKTLYFHGNREILSHGPRVSVVGSRRASAEGQKRARSLARALVDHGIVVVSGLAEGIDTAAHTSALEAGGETIAVIGTPLDVYYPKENQELQQRLEREQLVITQFPIGSAVTPKNFPIRNRTMALLTDATVIVEAGEKAERFIRGGKHCASAAIVSVGERRRRCNPVLARKDDSLWRPRSVARQPRRNAVRYSSRHSSLRQRIGGLRLISRVPFATPFVYSTKGISEVSTKSENFATGLKPTTFVFSSKLRSISSSSSPAANFHSFSDPTSCWYPSPAMRR